MAELAHRRYPCAECPWRADVAPGQFPACRYEALAGTTGSPGHEAPIGAPMFACHKTEGREQACAGWLAAVGIEHLGVRLAAIREELPPEALRPGPDWPPLRSSYRELAEANGVAPDHPALDGMP